MAAAERVARHPRLLQERVRGSQEDIPYQDCNEDGTETTGILWDACRVYPCPCRLPARLFLWIPRREEAIRIAPTEVAYRVPRVGMIVGSHWRL